MANANLSEFMRDHVAIMNKQIEEAPDDTDAASAICNMFVFIMRDGGIDPHRWVDDSMAMCAGIEAEQAAKRAS